LLLIAPFAVIHDSANWRAGSGRDLDQIEARFTRHAQGIGRGDNADLFFFIVDEPNGGDADLFVVAEVRRNGLRLLK
jgi:hypothetical protein